MKKLLLILLLLPFIGMSQVTTFSLPTIPITTDFLNADRGAHLWINRDAPYGTIHIPTSGAPQEMMDYYYRFNMTHFFTGAGTDSTINFSFFRARMTEAIVKKMGIRWRVMALCNNCGNPPGDNFNNLVNFGGGWSSYPSFLHDLMQAEPNPDNRDFFSTRGDNDGWIANVNSLEFRRWVRKLAQQQRNYIDTAVINGTPLRFAIRIYDLGYYGCYSEQHSNCLCDAISDGNIPVGARHTAASLIDLVDAQLDAMGGNSNWKYVIPFNAFDAMWLGHTLNPIAYDQYLLDHPDSISWINDHIGANESYDHDYLENNNRIGTGYNSKLMSRWMYSPTGGEPVGWGSPADRSAIPQYVQDYHMSFFGNGNLDHITNSFTTEANNVRLASRLAGYRLKITGGFYNPGASLVISTNWINEGNAPIYFPWTVQYLIKNGSTTVATLTSSFNPRYFQPSASPTTHQQAFGYPAIPTGQYGLYVIVKDANNYRNPMFLANTPRQSDGSYFLGNITIPVTGSNIPPIANAGPNQSITGTSVSLNGSSSSDPDGTISTYAWSLVSGPNTPTIVSPSSANTNVTGLVAGVYVFNLTVTDNLGATGSDQVQITVGGNQPPVANAGPNQAITLPTSSVTVNGSGSTDDVAIATYAWTQVGGPIIATIVSPSSASSNITGLTTAGIYTFRLTVTDGPGLTHFDDMTVTVSSGNSAPIANANVNQTITQPTSSATLNGTLSTDDVGITAYLWTQVGGPTTATIASPTSATSNVSALTTVGVYIFRLRVEDVAGLFSIDDMTITVVSSTNQAPIAVAGPDVVLTWPTNFTQLNGTGSSDPESGPLTYSWTKVSGPSSFSCIICPSGNPIVNVESLQIGVYVMRLTVTDNQGLSSFDEVTITVLGPSDACPVANAGGNQSLTLPTSSTSLSGSGTDDVGITSYLWFQVSGPSAISFGTPTAATTTASNMIVAGTYVIRFRVGDVQNCFDTDDVIIIVNAAANNAPVAIITITAGTQSMQLPTNSITLSGVTSTDDVAVVSYAWSQISGPSTATIAAPTSTSSAFNNLIEGVYFFQLTVTDGGGLTDSDVIQVTVLAADPPDPPVVGGKALFKTGVKFLPRTQ